MASLKTLPEELLKEILDDDSDRDENVEELYNLCLVSKKFRSIAQPLLLSTFIDYGTLENLEETIRFANCLFRYPELGQFVQEITLSYPIEIDQSESDEEGAFEPSGRDIELWTTEIKNLGLDGQENKWVSAMKMGDLAVFAALITNRTPNLLRLTMPGKLSTVNPFPELARHNPSFLRKLDSLCLTGLNENDGYDIASYQDLLALPSLRIIYFSNGDLQSKTCPSTWDNGALNIEELIFGGCVIDAASLDKLTRACKKLKAFSIDNFKPDEKWMTNIDRGSLFNATDAHKALSRHKDTLECLRIEFPRRDSELQNWQRFLSSRVKMGSLRQFPVLEEIHLQQAITSVHPELSPALKRLVIADCNSSVINLVKNIAKDSKKGLYPDFVDFRMFAVDITQPIQLPGQIIPKGKTPEQAHMSLVDLFKGTNVEFLIAPFAMPGHDDFMDDYDYEDDYFDDDDIPYGSEGENEDSILDALRRVRERGPAPGGDGPNGPMPPELLEYFMRRAMQDPDFAHLRPPSGNSRRPPWEA